MNWYHLEWNTEFTHTKWYQLEWNTEFTHAKWYLERTTEFTQSGDGFFLACDDFGKTWYQLERTSEYISLETDGNVSADFPASPVPTCGLLVLLSV